MQGVNAPCGQSVIVPSALMHSMKSDTLSLWDVVDLDPYGTATPFLDSAVQSVTDGGEPPHDHSSFNLVGLLCVTCTDMAVLAGSHPETCFAKYGSSTVKGAFCHEMVRKPIEKRLTIDSGCAHSSIYDIDHCDSLRPIHRTRSFPRCPRRS